MTGLRKTNKVYLITGAQGFIGAWIVRLLLENEVTSPSNIIATDLRFDDGVLSQVVPAKQLSQITRLNVDVTKTSDVYNAYLKYKPDYVLHLAGLQIPTCRARPVLGGMVNVIGTLNIFEGIRKFNSENKSGKKINGVVYASSAGICGLREDYKNGCSNDNDRHKPRTHYGYYKLCNEGNARIFWQDHNIASVGLRPSTVYGVGRELGLTSDATKAIKSAIVGQPFVVNYREECVFNYVKDMAQLWIECCDKVLNPDSKVKGAYNCNISGSSMKVKEFLEYLYELVPQAKQLITLNPNGILLPVPGKMTQDTLDQLFGGKGKVQVTPVKDAVRETVEMFQQLRRENRLHTRDIQQSKL